MEAKGAKEGGQKNVQKLAKKMRQKKESKKREGGGGGIYIQKWDYKNRKECSISIIEHQR